MGVIAASPYCIQCESRDHWIQLVVVDEHNQPFDNVKGTLTDALGVQYPIRLNGMPILLTGLHVGRVTIELEPPEWLARSQNRTPFIMEKSDNIDYVMQPQDSLSKIASQNGMTLEAILALNPQYQDNPNLIIVGDTVKLNTQMMVDPVDVWLQQNATGHQSEPRKLINVTTGDFLTSEQAQDLPERHQAKQADKEYFVTDRSYVLKVRGFNYITLRFGVFFDGTANNTYSAQWGKRQLEGYYHQWQVLRNLEGSRPVKDWQASSYRYPNQDDFYWFWQDDQKVASSAANELTNIQKLYERYISDEFNQDQTVFYHSEYITGIGTGNSTKVAKADESIISQALGTGKYGIEAKVVTAIEQLAGQLKPIAIALSPRKVDGINKVELDVFGFSRGAAAARHFINVALDGEQGEFVSKFVEACQQSDLILQTGFDWDSNDHCEITFAGLFDTVAAIADFTQFDVSPHNQDNGNVRLWLEPTRVRHAVHLTASPKTEYRYNFSSNKLNSAPNFHEIMVYGAHSDVGGGYYSQYAFDQNEYLLPLIERKRIKRIVRDFDWTNSARVKQQIEQSLLKVLEQEIQQGWNRDDYTIIPIEKRRIGNNEKEQLVGELYLQRIVAGDLSRLYLRAMYGLAEFMQVPMSDISIKNNQVVWDNSKEKGFIVPELIYRDDLSSITFATLCDGMLQLAKQGNVEELVRHLSSPDVLAAFMKYNLIHHSSDDGIANTPNTNDQGKYDRAQYDM